MTFVSLFNRTATTEREGFVSGSDVKKTYTSHLSSFSCHFQPLDEAISTDGTATFGKNWLMMCPVIDIKEGDKVIMDSFEYKVVGVENYDFSRNPHLEVILRTFNHT